MNKKKHGFVYTSKLVDMQKLVDSLRGYPEIVFFGCFLCFDQPLGARSTQKLVKIHNKQLHLTGIELDYSTPLSHTCRFGYAFQTWKPNNTLQFYCIFVHCIF